MGEERFLALYKDYSALNSAISLLGWDQQVLMPAKGAESRAGHIQRIKRLAHEILTGDEMARALEDAEQSSSPDSFIGLAAQALRRDLDIQGRLPIDLVERKARVTAQAYEVWRVARPASDFAMMRPYYQEVVDIARETAEAIGYSEHPYDALIGLFEHGATYASARAVFDEIRPVIVELVSEIRERGSSNEDAPLRGDFEPERLRAFAQAAASRIGYDFDRGRLDLCRNAFCTHLSSDDVRMTTRPSDHVKGVISSSFHEMGHGLYEQGVDPSFSETPLSGGISLAVHESQSRLWENVIGRSLGFWRCFLPELQSLFPELGSLSPESMMRMMNRVNPEFIRVGADELTYNLHILVRFELEVEMITGSLSLGDLPEAWNERYRRYLGIDPPSDTLGCLQDVHWSRGSMGYFPTYTMGNLIGSQVWETLLGEIGDPEEDFARGDFSSVLGWLSDRIYRHGRTFPPRELVTRVTGRPMEAGPWLKYATTKYRSLYGLDA